MRSVLPADNEHMIETRNLVKAVDTSEGVLTILKGISIHIAAGEAVAIIGASGSGKSTLLGLMAGLDGSSSGEILLDGYELSQLDEEQRAIPVSYTHLTLPTKRIV